MAQFIVGAFGWRRIGVVVGSNGARYFVVVVRAFFCVHKCIQLDVFTCTAYSNDGAGAFIEMANKYGITLVATPVFKSGSSDMSETIRQLKASGCPGIVAFAYVEDMVELLIESDKQQFQGVWITGDTVVAEYSSVLRVLSARHSNPLKLLRGLYGILFGNGLGLPRNNQFTKDWYVSSCTPQTLCLSRSPQPPPPPPLYI